jgi:hypothetical protein
VFKIYFDPPSGREAVTEKPCFEVRSYAEQQQRPGKKLFSEKRPEKKIILR